MPFEDKDKTRNGYRSIRCFDPRDSGQWDLLISNEKLALVNRLGREFHSNLAYLVPQTISMPHCVFEGLREDKDKESWDGWLCYARCPDHSYPQGRKERPFPNQIFLVFVTMDRVIYSWRWDKAETGSPMLPIHHATRFEKRLI